MTSLVLPLPGNEPLAASLAQRTRWEVASLGTRTFPDGETYLRVQADCCRKNVFLVCTLDRPDAKLLPLLFAADTVREFGAARVGLVAPYLAYMRQDRRFQDGEAVTSRIFADLLSSRFDWLVTLDPHLHRYRTLGELYRIRTWVLHAAPLLASWIAANVERPLLVGPDEESAQWVADVARPSRSPYVVSTKLRRGDRDVEISLPDVGGYRDRTPVVLDDIVSSGRTMVQAVRCLAVAGLPPPVCVGVHGIFAGTAHSELVAAGAGRIVTTNSVPHPTNGIDVSNLIASSLTALAS